MGFWSNVGKAINPAGKNFLGLGKVGGRVVGGIVTLGNEELFRPDAFGAKRKTAFAKGIGGFTTGAASGAATGFITGGPYGAVVGAGIGGVGGAAAGITGASNNYTPIGVLKNIGIGIGGGLAGGGIAHYAASSAALAVKTPVLAGAVTAPTASSAVVAGVAAPATGSSAWSTLATALLLGGIQRPSGSPGSAGPQEVSVSGTGPGPGNQGASVGPTGYPGLSPTGYDVAAPTGSTILAQATSPIGVMVLAAVALVAFLLFKRKR